MTTPPCSGKWALFDSTDPNDHAEARLMCLHSCHLLELCQQRLSQTLKEAPRDPQCGPSGTWAGELFPRRFTPTGRRKRNAATLAAEEAAYDEEAARAAHRAWTHHNDRSEWASTGERVYQRRIARRRAVA